MEGGSSSGSPPSFAPYPAARSADGPSKFLADLPSRGFFSSTVVPSNPEEMRVYICNHDTSPPADQVIKTNQTNILVRSLMLNNQKGDSSSKDVKVAAANQGSRKRIAEKPLEKIEAKKPMPIAPLKVADEALDKAEGKRPMSSAQLASLPPNPSSELRRIKKDLIKHARDNALRWRYLPEEFSNIYPKYLRNTSQY